MGEEGVTSINEVEGWRTSLLLLGFATVTLILEKTLHLLEKLVANERGLSIALQHIKNELLFVGSISLLLSALQSPLAKICIPLGDEGVYAMDHRRLLSAGGETDYCAPDKRSLWPVELQHDTHIFIFVVGCTHIVYGTLTVYMTLLRVRRWRTWEEEAVAQGRSNDLLVMPIPAKWFYRNVGSNWLIHWLMSILRQYYFSVNKSLYVNARLQFIEKWNLPYDFDFHDIVVRILEDELMKTLHPEWHLWLIAVVWFAIPPPSYVSYWMYGLSVITTLVIGGKLVDILVQISVQVAIKYHGSVVYGRMEANPAAHRGITALGRSSVRNVAVRSPTVHRRFVDAIHKAAGLAVGSGQADSGAGASGGGGGILPPPAEMTAEQLSSRDQALQMIRSWASTLSVRSVRPPKEAVGAATADGAEEGQEQAATVTTTATAPEAPPPLSPSATALQVAGCGSGGGAVPPAPSGPGDGPTPPPATPREVRGLARGSAPAAFRRQRPEDSWRAGPALQTAGSAADGAGASGPALGGRAMRKMSVIREGSVAVPRVARRTVGAHRHHHHQHDHHHHHRQHDHHRDLQPSGQGQDAANGGVGDKLPRAGSSRRYAGGVEAAMATVLSARRSVFELFQRNPEHHTRTKSLHSAFHTPLPYDGGLSSRRQPTQSPPRSPKAVGTRGSPITTAAPVTAAAAAPAQGSPRLGTLRAAPGPSGAATTANTSTATHPLASGGAPGDEAASAAAVAAPGPAALLVEEFQPPKASVTTAGQDPSSSPPSLLANGDAAAAKAAVAVLTVANGGGEPANGGDGHDHAPINGAANAATAAGAAAAGAAAAAAARAPRLTVSPLSSCSGSGSGSGSSVVSSLPDGTWSGSATRVASRMFRVTKTRSGRRKVPLLLLPCYCGKYTLGSQQYVRDLLSRGQRSGFHLVDAKDFFWFGRPRFLIALFTLAYFQNSLSIAICIFSLTGKFYENLAAWQAVNTGGIVLQLCLDLLLLPQVALAILPLYALIAPLGSHCNRELLERAIRENTAPRRPPQASALGFRLSSGFKSRGNAVLCRIKAALGLGPKPGQARRLAPGLSSAASMRQEGGRGARSEPMMGGPGSRGVSGRARSSILLNQTGYPSEAKLRAQALRDAYVGECPRTHQPSVKWQDSPLYHQLLEQQAREGEGAGGSRPARSSSIGTRAIKRLTFALSSRRGAGGGGDGGDCNADGIRDERSASWVAVDMRGTEEAAAGTLSGSELHAYAGPGVAGGGPSRSGVSGLYRRAVASFVGRSVPGSPLSNRSSGRNAAGSSPRLVGGEGLGGEEDDHPV